MTSSTDFANSVDLIFPATGHAIPLDHAYALSAISHLLPAICHAKDIGIFPLYTRPPIHETTPVVPITGSINPVGQG